MSRDLWFRPRRRFNFGIDWLETNGKTAIDWEQKTISFEENKWVITLNEYCITDKHNNTVLQGILYEVVIDWADDVRMVERHNSSCVGKTDMLSIEKSKSSKWSQQIG